MKPLSLTLKGFRGIRDGLGRDLLTLDFGRLTDDAQLVAIAGGNGRGKTTVMDNMHPYLTMPSRASAAGPGGFSYYDHVCLPESEKDLTWEHDGRRYRSQVVIRSNGKRKTEAYLFARHGEHWRPVALADGTVSDGKAETYARCVEGICGSAETFFTSVFSAQGKRQLAAYKNAEIKTLLADLLGLEEIRALGHKATDTTKLLKAGLLAIRQEQAGLDEEARRIASERARLADADTRVAQAIARKSDAQRMLDAARIAEAGLVAAKAQAQQVDARRSALCAERQAVIEAGRQASAALDAQEAGEHQRLGRLQQRLAARLTQTHARRQALDATRRQLSDIAASAATVQRASRRHALAERIVAARTSRITRLRMDVQCLVEQQGNEKALVQKLEAIEREAGQASLKAADLARRIGLADEVPCAGTDLQGRCMLLGDVMAARALRPDASLLISRLAQRKAATKEELVVLRRHIKALVDAPQRLATAEHHAARARARATRLAVWAAKAGEVAQACAALAGIDREMAALARADADGETADERAERDQIAAACRAIAAQRSRQTARDREALQRIEHAVAALPAPFDAQRLSEARHALERAAVAVTAAEQSHAAALRDAQALEAAQCQTAALAARHARVAGHAATVEAELSGWMLFARCLSNDGIIALAIDDAGPVLSALANDLLLACYGARFTVSIKTVMETANGGQREGFDVMVRDGASDGCKSVGLMSGGERVWINECLVRAIALYLAQHSGRRYATLFSDEADGALDPAHKRMFIDMKREVLRLGGYRQEFFISQTPELTALADATIDLDAMAA